MTTIIDRTLNQLDLTKEKIIETKRIINILHYYTNVNNNETTSEMLKEVIRHCNSLIESDF